MKQNYFKISPSECSSDYKMNFLIFQNLIKGMFGKSAEISNIELLAGGRINKSFRLTLRNPLLSLHLKVYGGDNPEVRANREKFFCNILRLRTNIPVPLIFLVDTSRKIIGEVFSLQYSLPGVNLDELFNKLSSEEKALIGFQLGGYLAQLHAIKLSSEEKAIFGGVNGKEQSWYKSFLSRVFDNFSWCAKRGIISQESLNFLSDYIEKREWLVSMNKPSVLLHSDIHPGNIMVRRNKDGKLEIIGIYDFEDSRLGHDEFDFVKPSWAFSEYYSEVWDSMLKAYNRIRKLSPLFSLRINTVYRLGEISEFLVFGAKNGMVSEVEENISFIKELLVGDYGSENY